MARIRTNQPSPYRGTGTMTAFRCAKHDYEYYPSDWTGDNGITYRAGYYDEKGNYYRNLAVKNLSTMLTCKYCGNQMVYTWKEGDVPSCSKCGANYEIDIVDRPMNEFINVAKMLMCVYGVLIALAMGIVIVFQVISMVFTAILGNLGSPTGNPTDGSEQAHRTMPSEVYVEEIGRTCYLNGENYFDPDTGCWFWWNDEIEPAQWQYWYEGISNDYEDYGWLEYDDYKQSWWIEMSEGSWGELNSDFYDTSNMWHFKSAYVNELY